MVVVIGDHNLAAVAQCHDDLVLDAGIFDLLLLSRGVLRIAVGFHLNVIDCTFKDPLGGTGIIDVGYRGVCRFHYACADDLIFTFQYDSFRVFGCVDLVAAVFHDSGDLDLVQIALIGVHVIEVVFEFRNAAVKRAQSGRDAGDFSLQSSLLSNLSHLLYTEEGVTFFFIAQLKADPDDAAVAEAVYGLLEHRSDQAADR